jgi:hypothetical protein
MIQVNEVEYKCLDEKAEAIGIVKRSNIKRKYLSLRKFLEVNEKQCVLTRITRLKDCNVRVVSIPNSVENLKKSCFSWRKPVCDVVFELDSKLKRISKCFRGSGIKIIRIQTSVENLEDSCFRFEFQFI